MLQKSAKGVSEREERATSFALMGPIHDARHFTRPVVEADIIRVRLTALPEQSRSVSAAAI